MTKELSIGWSRKRIRKPVNHGLGQNAPAALKRPKRALPFAGIRVTSPACTRERAVANRDRCQQPPTKLLRALPDLSELQNDYRIDHVEFAELRNARSCMPAQCYSSRYAQNSNKMYRANERRSFSILILCSYCGGRAGQGLQDW